MNTYAVIETGGKQYKVEKGTSLLVDRLSAKEGDKVALRPVMFRDKEVVAGGKELEKVKVEATVTEHLRGAEDQGLQIQAEEGLPPPRRPPLRADQARGDRDQPGQPQSGRAEERGAGAKKEAAPKAAKPAEKKRLRRKNRPRPKNRPRKKRPRKPHQQKLRKKPRLKKPASQSQKTCRESHNKISGQKSETGC